MNTPIISNTDVLIAGAGPSGLTLACELRRRGVACRIIDKAAEFSISSRGKGLQPRSLEVLDDLGVVRTILAHGTSALRLRVYSHGTLIAQLDMSHGVRSRPDVPYPHLLMIPEWRTESILRDHLATLGVMVERGHELVDFQQDGDAVVATVRDVQTGATEQIRAAYLVGCDGGHSVVRKRLGLTFAGDTHEQHFVLGDMEVAGIEPQDTAYAWIHDDGLLASGRLPGTTAWQVIAEVRPNAAGEVEPASVELFQRLFAERAGLPDVRITNATWLSNYRVSRRMVDRYRVGRVFVAGDAAHVHSPAGGQGMNTGIQDAYNLGWKLALVLKGKAGDALLETYAAERMPIARKVLSGSDTGHNVIFSSNPVISFIREHALLPIVRHPAVIDVLMRKMAQLGFNYCGSSLAQESAARPNLVDWLRLRKAPRAGDRAPDGRCRTATSAPTTLFEQFRGPQFTLLLFGGTARAADYASLAAIGRQVVGRLGDEAKVYIVAGDDKPPALPDRGIGVLLDPTRELHMRYGVSAGALYLIRPDGYVGFRGQAAEAAPLLAYLGRVFQLDAARPDRACTLAAPTAAPASVRR